MDSKITFLEGAYHGGAFNGNDCRKLMKNVSVLEDIAPPEFHGFVDTFKSFYNVVKSCYGKEPEFKKSYMKLGISATPKVHAVFYHVSEFCDIKGMGLAPWSVQTAVFTLRFQQNVEKLHGPRNGASRLWETTIRRNRYV